LTRKFPFFFGQKFVKDETFSLIASEIVARTVGAYCLDAPAHASETFPQATVGPALA
jgi:hypothetical protein